MFIILIIVYSKNNDLELDCYVLLVLKECKFCYRHGKFQNAEAASGVVFKIFAKFTGKHLCQSLFLIKRLIELNKETLTYVFSCQVLRTTLLQATVSQNMKAYM